MGEKRRKLNSNKRYLLSNPKCAYCGADASTVDHCPPRCFFFERQWPEGHIVPSCEQCNTSSSLDEQSLAVLFRSRFQDDASSKEALELSKLMQGVINNQPKITAEWSSMLSATQQKRALRRVFGKAGDQLRYQGYGAVPILDETTGALNRFAVKLAKALYYIHTGLVFSGVIYHQHLSVFFVEDAEEYLENILKLAPRTVVTKRGNKHLGNQFEYRFNISENQDMFFSVIRFSDQFMFTIVAMSVDLVEVWEKLREESRQGPDLFVRTDCIVAN